MGNEQLIPDTSKNGIMSSKSIMNLSESRIDRRTRGEVTLGMVYVAVEVRR